tara:strand:+ start:511 stop:969 length:459 start_codon:yes stop_codon:yes gene_type:complete
MDKIKFKEVLMNIAVCAIACDGDIDDREIEALKKIEKETPYFSGVDLSNKLDKSLNQCLRDIEKFKENIFKKLKKIDLNIVQELMILEISLRIISADEIELEVEKDFIKDLRKYLKIEDFLIYERFGDISYLKVENVEIKLDNLKKIKTLKN